MNRNVQIFYFGLTILHTLLIQSCEQKLKPKQHGQEVVNVGTSLESKSTESSQRRITMCTARLPGRQLLEGRAVSEHDDTHKFINAKITTGSRVKSISEKNSKWPNREITIAFLGGDSTVRARIFNTACIWEKYADVKFQLARSVRTADITISFCPRSGTWSYIGKYCFNQIPSMNFDDLYPDSDDRIYRYYVLHEFGHALGLLHEHQSHKAKIVWNIPKLINYCSKYDPPWDSLMVLDQIVWPYEERYTDATAFDPTSIMMYSYPDSLVISGYVPQDINVSISYLDSVHISSIYPFKRRR